MDYRKRAYELEQKGYNRHEIVDILNNEGYTNTKGEAITYDGLRKALQPSRIHSIEGIEERLPPITDNGDYYTVTSGKRSVDITKDKLKELKDLYCNNKLTINQISAKLEMPRRDFILVKTAFSITKDDTPFLDEELINKSTDELVDITLEKKKNDYYIKLQQREIDQKLKELEKYKERDYFYKQVIEQMKIPPKEMNFNVIEPMGDKEALLNFADWHTGLKCDNFLNKYNLKIQEQRLKEVTERTIHYIKQNNIKTLHIMNLGDMLNGVIHTTTRLSNEVDMIEQFRIVVYSLSDILSTISKDVNKINYYNVRGNHGRITANKTEALDKENLESLIPDFLEARLQNFKNIEFVKNDIDDEIITANINGSLVYGIHGDKDKPEKVASDLTMMLETKPTQIFTAHMHHKEMLEQHKVDVIMSRSLSGVDTYAKDLRKTSKAGQSLYIYDEKGLECTYDITF